MALRIACVGAGWAGTTHIEAASTIPEVVDYTAIVDSDPVHLREIADHFGIGQRYASLGQALSDAEIDAVDIATPHRLHASMAIAGAEAGKHVMVEKPMAMNVAEATTMVDAAEANGVALFVAENVAYESRINFLRAVILEDELVGELTAATVTAGFRAEGECGYPGRRAWLAEPEHGGTGTWMLHGIHTIAGMRQVFGEFASIYMTEHKTP